MSSPRRRAGFTGWSGCGATRRTSPPSSPARRRAMSAAKKLRSAVRTGDAAMRALVDTLEKVVDHDVSILLLGESGSGKNFLAQAIHAGGSRRDKPFVHIDCASIPADLFESELFGYEKGTFTDAAARKLGKLEMARGGTGSFCEIAALAPPLPGEVLR